MSEVLTHLPRQATEDEILQAFADRLAEMPGCNNGICVVSDQPIPIVLPHGKLAFTVSMGDSQYNEPSQRGGSFSNLFCDCTVVVGIFLQSAVDRVGRAEALERSFSKWLQLVIAYLLKASPEKDRCQAWEPAKNQRLLLSSQIVIRSATGIRDVPGHETWYGREISFGVEYAPNLKIVNE